MATLTPVPSERLVTLLEEHPFLTTHGFGRVQFEPENQAMGSGCGPRVQAGTPVSATGARVVGPLLIHHVLYVSPCARHFGLSEADAAPLAADLVQVDADDISRVYRRLDAEWFAWLAHRTAQARRMVRGGELSAEQAAAVDEVQARLRIVRTWALRHLDSMKLEIAINRGISRNYSVPCRRPGSDLTARNIFGHKS
ncbi:MAG: hypothetical protein ACOCXA_00035 [Planctomycetota bacterium]